MISVTGAYEGVLAKRFIMDPLVVQVLTLQSPRGPLPFIGFESDPTYFARI